MTTHEAQEYLHKNIPITKEMGLTVDALSASRVKLSAPLVHNINHRSSAFGGSIASILLTTGWAYLRVLMKNEENVPVIVISDGRFRFLKPVLDDFEAEIEIPRTREIEQFFHTFKRFGKARITLHAFIKEGKTVLAKSEGEYVVIRGK